MVVGFNNRFTEPILDGSKKHTIREDRSDRLSVGVMLHLATGTRTKRYRLLRKTPCLGSQQIRIVYGNGGYSSAFVYQDCRVIVDGRELSYAEVNELAKNDGFEDQDAFFRWFSKDFTGKIIHWTNIKY